MEIRAIKTWVSHSHGVVSVSDDVLGIVQRIKAIDSRLSVWFNEQTNRFDVVETCLDGTDRLVFSVDSLDQRVVDRLLRADHWGGNDTPDRFILGDDQDVIARIDADNEALQEKITREQMDRVAEAGEMIAHYMDLPLRGNVGYKEQIFVKRSPFVQDEPRADKD